MITVVCKRCKDTRLECSGKPGYCIPCAQDLADYEAFDGEPAMLAGRWKNQKRPVYDALSEEIDRSPIVRFMSGAGAGLEADPDAKSMFPDAIRGEE